MDYLLNYADYHLFTPYVYPSAWAEDDIFRQYLSLMVIVTIGGYLLYLIPATLSYYVIYNHDLEKHPLFLENQIRREIKCALSSVLVMSLVSNIIFLMEVRGYSKLYDNVNDINLGWLGILINAVAFIFFTDTLIYWIHRGLHSKLLYKPLHKIHHTWKVTTPFASHAFHPIDGFLQSTPYHLYVFLFPMHKISYLFMFVFVNIWTISIHDGDYRVPDLFKYIVNGSAHHMDHHVFYNYNYGQFFTFWDRLGGSFRNPSAYEGKGPTFEVKLSIARKANKKLPKKMK